MPAIQSINAHKILDSNGHWTIQTLITLDNGLQALASVPTAHSAGKYEAKTVATEIAVDKINSLIAGHIKGIDVSKQEEIDNLLLKLDGTNDRSALGANTILAVSLCTFNAAAISQGTEPYLYINRRYDFPAIDIEKFPTPLLNLINGGAHSSNNLAFQSFMISPGTFNNYSKSLEMGVLVYHKLKEILVYKSLKVDVGEEGGFSPSGLDPEQVCHHIVEAIIESGIKAGSEMFLAIDVAASTFYDPPNYQTKGVLGAISSEQLLEMYVNLSRNFPILYLEDPFAEDSWEDWIKLKKLIGGSVEIIGDDLTVTHVKRLETAISRNAITGIIIKPNQIGTLSETINVIKMANKNNLTVIISHRSGETAEDTFIADLAVGVGANYIKAGAPARGERTSKYNRLLEIEHRIKTQKDAQQAVDLNKPPRVQINPEAALKKTSKPTAVIQRKKIANANPPVQKQPVKHEPSNNTEEPIIFNPVTTQPKSNEGKAPPKLSRNDPLMPLKEEPAKPVAVPGETVFHTSTGPKPPQNPIETTELSDATPTLLRQPPPPPSPPKSTISEEDSE